LLAGKPSAVGFQLLKCPTETIFFRQSKIQNLLVGSWEAFSRQPSASETPAEPSSSGNRKSKI
jgi:hypothetical protein